MTRIKLARKAREISQLSTRDELARELLRCSAIFRLQSNELLKAAMDLEQRAIRIERGGLSLEGPA